MHLCPANARWSTDVRNKTCPSGHDQTVFWSNSSDCLSCTHKLQVLCSPGTCPIPGGRICSVHGLSQTLAVGHADSGKQTAFIRFLPLQLKGGLFRLGRTVECAFLSFSNTLSSLASVPCRGWPGIFCKVEPTHASSFSSLPPFPMHHALNVLWVTTPFQVLWWVLEVQGESDVALLSWRSK